MKNEKHFQLSREDRLLRAIADAGYSDTRARRAVVKALCGSDSRATPADLLERGRAYCANLGQVTVYRTLDIMRSLGLVRRLHGEDGHSSYAEAGCEHGHHVLCRGCGRAAEFTGCSIQGTLSSAARQTGFEVDGHRLEVLGLCPRCRSYTRRGDRAERKGKRACA